MTKEEIAVVLDRHLKWLRGEADGARAYLTRAYLADAYLADAYLTRAYLADAYLADAYLTRANLTGADLTRANLAGAYLAGAYLTGANLAGAYLTGANLARADLTDANLTGADLTRANLTGADLTGANLTGAYLADANLAGAYLTGADLADADLTDADLTRANHDLVIPIVEQLDVKVLAAIEAAPQHFNMSAWHLDEDGCQTEPGAGCGTTHCRAGWAIHLAGKEGYELEAKVGPHTAGTLIYLKSTGRVPSFGESNDDALADIRACAAKQLASTEGAE